MHRHYWFPCEMTPLVRNSSLEIPYWWSVYQQPGSHNPELGWCFWVVEANFPHSRTNQKHYPYLGSDTSSWNFCARFSDVILRGNQWWPTSSPGRFSLALEVGGKSALGTRLQWWHHEMSAVFDGYLRKCCLPINTYLYSLNRELSVCLYPEIKLFAQFPSFIQ